MASKEVHVLIPETCEGLGTELPSMENVLSYDEVKDLEMA